MTHQSLRLFGALLSCVVLLPVPALAQLPNLADITGINVDVPNGRISIGQPESPFRTIERVTHVVVGAPAKQFILSAKANAGPGQPVPPAMYDQLVALGVRQDLLRRARWSTNWRAVDTVFTADATAVALEELIVFRNPSEVFNNAPLWVHELKHFEQYERLGLDRFAAEYTVNRWVYENEATDAENRAANQLAGRNGTGRTPQRSQLQPTYYSYCTTPGGNSPVITGGYPSGAPCWIQTASGPAWGTVVGFLR